MAPEIAARIAEAERVAAEAEAEAAAYAEHAAAVQAEHDLKHQEQLQVLLFFSFAEDATSAVLLIFGLSSISKFQKHDAVCQP